MTVEFGPSGPLRDILVMGLGNPNRGDDGVGAMVAQTLRGRLPADVTLLCRGGDMLSLIEDWTGFDALICVDAAASMGEPGRIHRFDLATDELPPEASVTSSHALGLAEVIGLARTLRLAPAEIIVYAIEGGNFDEGAAVTSAVACAVEAVADRIRSEVGRLRRARVAAV